MNQSPKAGEAYQLCKHLAAATVREPRHAWSVAGRAAWVVLCAECHKRIGQRIAAALAAEVGHFAPAAKPATAQPATPLEAWQPIVDKLADGVRAVVVAWSEREQQEKQRQEHAAAWQEAQKQIDALAALVSEQTRLIANLQATAIEREQMITNTLRRVADDLIPPRPRRARR